MRQGRPLQRRSRLNPRSAKRKLAEAELAVAREQRRRQAGGWCEGNTPACRPGPHLGYHAHHVARRSQGGGHEVENLRWLCWDGHTWVHDHPREAAERGLLARREANQ